MLRLPRPALVALILGGMITSVTAQTQAPPAPPAPAIAGTTQPAPPPPTTVAPTAPAGNAVAALVNGQPITEAAVQRGLKGVEKSKQAEARPELVNYLVENMLVDQYLLQLQVKVEPAEVDKRVADMKTELQKQNQSYEEKLKRLELTEQELRLLIAADLRWDKFATEHATDAELRNLFNGNKDMFDGSTVHARHILLPLTVADGPARLMKMKQEIEAQVAKGLTEKLTPAADALTREKMRRELLEQAFSDTAMKNSTCPSKVKGGDVGSFNRAGFMVEPFSKVAFSLKPYQMSDVVQTQFGYHLILVLEHQAGPMVDFEKVKDDVKEVYCDRLREAVVAKMKPAAQIVITPASKP